MHLHILWASKGSVWASKGSVNGEYRWRNGFCELLHLGDGASRRLITLSTAPGSSQLVVYLNLQ